MSMEIAWPCNYISKTSPIASMQLPRIKMSFIQFYQLKKVKFSAIVNEWTFRHKLAYWWRFPVHVNWLETIMASALYFLLIGLKWTPVNYMPHRWFDPLLTWCMQVSTWILESSTLSLIMSTMQWMDVHSPPIKKMIQVNY